MIDLIYMCQNWITFVFVCLRRLRKIQVVHFWSFLHLNQFDLPQANYVTSISGSISRNPGLGDGVSWRGYAELGGAQCPILWHFKAPSVSPLFKPLGMTHLWQCYITDNALKAPAALAWKTPHSWLILLSLWQRKHTSAQRDVSMVHGPLQHGWWSACGVEHAPWVSGLCHSFFFRHKDDVFTVASLQPTTHHVCYSHVMLH